MSQSNMGAGPTARLTSEQKQSKRDRLSLDVWKAIGNASEMFSAEEIAQMVDRQLAEIQADEP